MCLKSVFLHFMCMIGLMALAHAAYASESPQSALREAYEQARQAGRSSAYPFIIGSHEQGNRLSADVFMPLAVGFPLFRQRLAQPRHWCDFLILTLNIKSCVFRRDTSHQYLLIYAGRKEYQPPEITYQIKYAFHIDQDQAEYFSTRMSAQNGPMLTHNYNIELEAVPDGHKTLLHLRMSYETSIFSRAATFTYLETLGRNKIGFTVTGQDKQGKPIYIKGVQAIIERNVMRYFLALEVYLGVMGKNNPPVFRGMLRRWFDATEKYHLQLYEYDKSTYMKAKLKEYLNQQKLQQKADSVAVAK